MISSTFDGLLGCNSIIKSRSMCIKCTEPIHCCSGKTYFLYECSHVRIGLYLLALFPVILDIPLNTFMCSSESAG